jgi:hypothetical protein
LSLIYAKRAVARPINGLVRYPKWVVVNEVYIFRAAFSSCVRVYYRLWSICGRVSWIMGTSRGAWWCSSALLAAFVVALICGSVSWIMVAFIFGRVSWSMMAFICGRISGGMVLQGVHLRSRLGGLGRVCTGLRLQLTCAAFISCVRVCYLLWSIVLQDIDLRARRYCAASSAASVLLS